MLRFDDGSGVQARAAVLPMGARYRRLSLDRLEEFEGVSAFYAAAPTEARLCAGRQIAIVGGGSSAGPPARRREPGGQTPLALKTSRPGVFCVSDGRAASVERVAVAVGEGAMAVRMLHERLESTRLSSNVIQHQPTTNGGLQHV